MFPFGSTMPQGGGAVFFHRGVFESCDSKHAWIKLWIGWVDARLGINLPRFRLGIARVAVASSDNGVGGEAEIGWIPPGFVRTQQIGPEVPHLSEPEARLKITEIQTTVESCTGRITLGTMRRRTENHGAAWKCVTPACYLECTATTR